ncbi:hypothetical protein Fmac_000200 [Flemingia macrophylla]|uniref:RCC1-like domain-containing protein n=1 Tax=Flemingia macrophylla TaxID=520843 RepID=A0ABD1NDL6_9FABA
MEEGEKDESEGGVWSWGAGTDGQLGTTILEDEHFPKLLHQPLLSSVSSLACGGAHVIALTSAGKVLSWGRGNSGQLGHGEVVSNALYPKALTSLDDSFITHVAAGWSHSAFVSGLDFSAVSLSAVFLKRISVESDYTGCVFTCGDGSFGQLGHGDYASHSSPVKVSCFIDQHVAKVACGMRHSLVLLKGHCSGADCPGNQVYGFGSGKRGQLGVNIDRVKSVNVPRLVSGFEGEEIVEIAANGDHSAAVSVDGHVYTWGRGFKGFDDAHTPQCLNSTLNFTKIALGWNHALTMSGEGEVYMLGGNHPGVLGDPQNTKSEKHLPFSMHSGDQKRQPKCRTNRLREFVKKDSNMTALEFEDFREANLEKVPGLDGMKITDIASGAEHSFLFSEHGEIKTWGWGEHGQLGLGNTSDQISPVTVSLGYDLNEAASIRVFCGSGFTFALGSGSELPVAVYRMESQESSTYFGIHDALCWKAMCSAPKAPPKFDNYEGM